MEIDIFLLRQLGVVIQHVEHVHLARQEHRRFVEGGVSLDAIGENKTALGMPQGRESHR